MSFGDGDISETQVLLGALLLPSTPSGRILPLLDHNTLEAGVGSMARLSF